MRVLLVCLSLLSLLAIAPAHAQTEVGRSRQHVLSRRAAARLELTVGALSAVGGGVLVPYAGVQSICFDACDDARWRLAMAGGAMMIVSGVAGVIAGGVHAHRLRHRVGGARVVVAPYARGAGRAGGLTLALAF